MSKKSKRIFKKTSIQTLSILVIFLGLINILLLLLVFRPQLRQAFKSLKDKKQQEQIGKERNELFEQINPSEGYELAVSYGKLGPKMLEQGVIDFEKFKEVYDSGGQSLSKEQLNILTSGSNKKIKINRQNSYFLLNFFWAVGLGNKSKILSEGDMVKYGDGQPENFASTGGWTLSKSNPMDYYSKGDLISMTQDQEDLVLRVASNIYRPCCDNPTSFPDCNHGMALLGILELLAANGASEKEMYQEAKYINSYWFPSTYYDLALYFKNKEKKEFKDVDAKLVLGKDYSSGSGYSSAKKWLTDNGVVEEPPQQGGSCGV